MVSRDDIRFDGERNRCEQCDRSYGECRVHYESETLHGLRTDSMSWEVIKPTIERYEAARKDCESHRVDWRTRALAAEGKLDRLRVSRE